MNILKRLHREAKRWVAETARYYRLHHWRIAEFMERLAFCLGIGVIVGVPIALLAWSLTAGFVVATLTAMAAMLTLPE